ncbi:hypothetical protein AHIS1636_18650 [Arthrobacter mangrovi]|uniref:Uncharacterized protein n=1 Tax=Arthrobacter mangrovi TaxID=2966350 RepID=A0ABQ5MTY0_9MICC|nr:hypothetical protein AHIS1636_18650 [Arthrobacter mangrovi]
MFRVPAGLAAGSGSFGGLFLRNGIGVHGILPQSDAAAVRVRPGPADLPLEPPRHPAAVRHPDGPAAVTKPNRPCPSHLECNDGHTREE